MRAIIRRVDRALERSVIWLEDRRWTAPLRFILWVVVFSIPAAQSFALDAQDCGRLCIFRDVRWLLLFFGAGILLLPLRHYRGGGPMRALMGELARVNGSFAGSLWSLGQKRQAAQGKLSDGECEALCAALLHRIRDYAAVALEVKERPRLRATLAVPYSTPGSSKIDALRVWCYDETHDDRGYSVLLLRLEGSILPGAPAAYLSHEPQIIMDIAKVPGPAAQRALPYHAVLSIPLQACGPDGKPLAVVNIDADEPGFFRLEDVVLKVRPLVAPAVNAIGLVLQSRKKKGPYGFPILPS